MLLLCIKPIFYTVSYLLYLLPTSYYYTHTTVTSAGAEASATTPPACVRASLATQATTATHSPL
jgi:hypothetical protein